MGRYTPGLNLYVAGQDDTYDVEVDQNDNFEKIDAWKILQDSENTKLASKTEFGKVRIGTGLTVAKGIVNGPDMSQYEPLVAQKSGYNLDKGDSININSSNTLATLAAIFTLNSKFKDYEPTFTKKNGFNLEKSNAIDSDSEDQLATSAAVKKVNDKISTFGLKLSAEINLEKDTSVADAWTDTGYTLTDAILESAFILVDLFAMFDRNRHSLLYPTDKLLKSEIIFGVGFHSGGEYAMNVKLRIRDRKLEYFKTGNWDNVKFFGISTYKLSI